MDPHHVQLAMPQGREDDARAFYGGILGLTEIAKPAALAARGGGWFRLGRVEIHIGVEEPSAPARKAHPCIRVRDLSVSAERLRNAGVSVGDHDDDLPGHRRFYTVDPFGNRLELAQARPSAAAISVPDVFLSTGWRMVDVLRRLDSSVWTQDSALEGYTVSGLAAHTARAVQTVAAYLDAPPPPPEAAVVDAAGYVVRALADHDPVTSDFHTSVRARGDAAAQAGCRAVADAAAEALNLLTPRLSATRQDQVIAVLDGIAISLGDYLRTRIVELVVHLDDLSASVGDLTYELDDSAWRITAEVLAAVAVARLGGPEVVRSLSRAERHPGPVCAL